MKVETRVGIFILIAIGIFFYLSINIGAIRVDRDRYHVYKAYFDDTGGLDVKALVKIAGVEVGWVDEITLMEGGNAEVTLMVLKKNKLARNAYAIIQQEGLIGKKNLEIDPGDPSSGILLPGSALSMPGKSPASIGDLLDQFRDIAFNIHDIAHSFHNVFASRQGEENMHKAIRGVAHASDNLSQFSQTLELTVRENRKTIHELLHDFRQFAGRLEKETPAIFPEVEQSFKNIKLAFASDKIPRMVDTLHDAGVEFTDAAGYAKESFRGAESVMKKIDTGQGMLGKLINEDETYTDIKKTIKRFKNYVRTTDILKVAIDMHTETLLQTSDSKGYFEITLRPTSSYFYLLQLVASPRGRIERDKTFFEYFDEKGTKLQVDELVERGRDLIRFPGRVDTIHQQEDTILWGAQFGMRFNRVALRIGLFESTAGVGADWYVPLNTDKLHWVTTFEAFDFDGVYRLKDVRAHLKWINRVYFMKNLYTSFGIDDFYSKKDGTFFFGGGIRFGDDNLKYFFTMLPLNRV